jgi:hypothetical protein
LEKTGVSSFKGMEVPKEMELGKKFRSKAVYFEVMHDLAAS